MLSGALRVATSWKIGAAACDRHEPDLYILLLGKHRRPQNLVSRILDGDTEHAGWSLELRRGSPGDAALRRSIRTWYAWSSRASDCLLAV
jgi:hypothetical protein